MTVQLLTQDQISALLSELPGWSILENKLHRVFVFADFSQAFGFMTRAALFAEKHNHHPEWCNVYKKVEVDLVTHEASGITERDAAMARYMQELAAEYGFGTR